MKSIPISKLVKKTRQMDPKKLGRNTFTYIDISSIDKDTKAIINPQNLSVDDAPSRARKEIRMNDVLVATVRPNLNGVAIVPKRYDKQIASTGFCVLRADETLLDSYYLLYFTQTSHFIAHLTKLSIGAGYPAVSDDNILDTEIPIYPLSEQRRIATLLAKADRLRQLRRTARQLGETYLQSVFVEMFGDISTNPKRFALAEIREITKSLDSKRIPIEASIRQTRNGKYPYYGASGIIDYIDDYIFNEETLLVAEDGANLVARSTPIAFIANGKYWVNNHAHVFLITQKANIQYLCHFLNEMDLEPFVTGSAQPKLTATNLGTIKVLLPPLAEQERFAQVVRRYERLCAQQGEAERQAEGLFQALLEGAFGGEL